MMKKKYAGLVILLAFICLGHPGQEQEVPHSPSLELVMAGRGNVQQVLAVYRDGEDWTEQYKTWEEQTQGAIAAYLKVPQSQLVFRNYTMLEEKGMTVDVLWEGNVYTAVCDRKGKIASFVKISTY